MVVALTRVFARTAGSTSPEARPSSRWARRGGVRAALAMACCAGVLAGCSTASPSIGTTKEQAPAANAKAKFTARGSVDAAYVLGATPGRQLILADASGQQVGHGTADRYGSLIIWNLPPGGGYSFREIDGSRVEGTPAFSVLNGADPPPHSFYSSQHMTVGLNYITMRDGIKLAATLRLPLGETMADGPFPTVIEYSGYQIAAPGSLIEDEIGQYKGNPTLLPDTSTVVGSVITPLLGFATVSLQMRGSGCSGGAFDLFGPSTTYDGYDAVEIVASQPWVKGHKVGLVGISFSGISQLFVAGTDPPGLAAVAPLSVTDDLYSTGYPGGIYNSGFAASWVEQREADAQPAPAGGEPYARTLIEEGDRKCLANQALRLQTPTVASLMGSNTYRVPSLFNPRSPSVWAKNIRVPVFMVGAFQDEEVGGQWPALVPNLAADKQVWVTMLNGTHIDSLGPGTMSRWIEFLDIFVADQVPRVSPLFSSLVPEFYEKATGAPAGPLPALRFTNAASAAVARADFERDDPRVRVLFDNGGGSAGPGALQPVWELDFPSWPPPDAVPTRFYLGAGGGLLTASPGTKAQVSFRPNPAARPATDLAASANVWAALPPYDWAPVKGSDGLGFITPPLAHDLVVVGPASLDLMLMSSAADTDLQVTISEVRPDGKELFIQTGQLRAGDRALDPSLSTVLDPVPTYLEADARPLRHGAFTEVRIPILPFAYAFRAGSRIRITITAPGGDRPEWAYATPATDSKVVDTVGLGGVTPSQLVLGVIEGVNPPDPQPACPSLRGEPCRTYLPAGNGG